MNAAKYISKNGQIVIEVRQQDFRRTAWALYVNGSYMKTKVLPRSNTAIPQNFGFAAADFTAV